MTLLLGNFLLVKEKLGIDAEYLNFYGHFKAKLSLKYVNSLKSNKNSQANTLKPAKILLYWYRY